jgi:hypothetical protein
MIEDKMLEISGWDIDFEITRFRYHRYLMDEEWISKDGCTAGGIYLCSARNFNVGCFNGDTFDYTRFKFFEYFPDTEYHWDDGPPHGTVMPFRLIGHINNGE